MLARMLASEASSQTHSERRAIAYSAMNKARKSRKSFSAMSNGIGPCCSGRPWSTARDPQQRDYSDAAEFMAEYPDNDPTYGSTAFFEPAVQDRLFAQGKANYSKNAAGIRAKWTGEGKRLLATIGRWEFYG